MVKEKDIKVLEAIGGSDGYYWDMSAKIEYKGELYSIEDAGSGSGWIPHYSAVVKGNFERLRGSEAYEVSADSREYVMSTIVRLMERFVESGAKESYEEQEVDWRIVKKVDGNIVGD